MCETRQSLHYFYVMRLQGVDAKRYARHHPIQGEQFVKTPKTIQMFGSLGGGGEYDKHHVSHHVATPKLYDLGDANARRYVPP